MWNYSGLTLNQYGIASPCLAVLSVLSAASSPCPDLKLIHYKQLIRPSTYESRRSYQKGRLKPHQRSFRRPFKFQTDKKSVFHQHRAPSEAATYAFEQQVLSALDLTVLNTDIERERDGSGGCVAVFLYGQDDFFHVQTQVFGS